MREGLGGVGHTVGGRRVGAVGGWVGFPRSGGRVAARRGVGCAADVCWGGGGGVVLSWTWHGPRRV